jgi:alpha-glucosidase (family GH31 glycosyl hydrolase)
VRGGNVLIPYISHDIGGFHGKRIDFDLYARWIEFGTFSGLLRMHSAHENPREGNLRMPWNYGQRGIDLMRRYFTLRTQLIPYIYTYAWRAHRESLPILEPLYLEYPDLEEAYRHPHEYFFGAEMLVAPVLDPGGRQTVWLPPGDWVGFSDGRHYQGGGTFTAQYPVEEAPVFVRAGAVIPEQRPSDHSDARALDDLILNVYGSGSGRFELYEDDGESLNADEEGQHARTALTHTVSANGEHHLTIEPAQGAYRGQPAQRSYELRVHGAARPSSISVNGLEVGPLKWNAARAIASIELPARSIHERLDITWR